MVLKWLGEKLGHALGALLHQLITFLIGLVDAMGQYLFGAFWARLQWAAMGLVAMVMEAVLGSAPGFVAWFARAAWACPSVLVGVLKGFAGGGKTARDVV
eukprot:211822-Pyramimonas_sp.AAC.1